MVTKRYELTDIKWDQIKDTLPPEQTGNPRRPPKDSRIMLNRLPRELKKGFKVNDCADQRHA